MLPLLTKLADKQEHTVRELVEQLAKHFDLSEQDRRELLPSGAQFVFDNRVAWAKTYLKKAGLIDNPRRATIVINERGLKVLSERLRRINVAFLKQFPGFLEFQSLKKD
ncbi:MAG: winged helix-turn-helix domain-containing protein [Chitinophagaceae bacterium]